jgi:hypothetical protein
MTPLRSRKMASLLTRNYLCQLFWKLSHKTLSDQSKRAGGTRPLKWVLKVSIKR